MSMVAFLVSFLASTAGAICGIGGGVIIKPVLDLFQMASVSHDKFLIGLYSALYEFVLCWESGGVP